MIPAERLILAMICMQVISGFFIILFLVFIMGEARNGKHDDK